MDKTKQEHFRPIIQKRVRDLQEQLSESAEDAKAISPDRGIGRLSRLDSMQMQQMTLDAQNRRKHEMQRLKEALTRIEKGTYGICQLCRNDIAVERLEYQPDVLTCVSCAGGRR